MWINDDHYGCYVRWVGITTRRNGIKKYVCWMVCYVLHTNTECCSATCFTNRRLLCDGVRIIICCFCREILPFWGEPGDHWEVRVRLLCMYPIIRVLHHLLHRVGSRNAFLCDTGPLIRKQSCCAATRIHELNFVCKLHPLCGVLVIMLVNNDYPIEISLHSV